ncbi:sensor domain-containing protein [Mycolicibacterium sp. S2-37]|uniref:sensor domain-containing protein n=1 Tax=Mycolicibacterium sp. S2-37 TaxID=2810297 RepID=UPI001A93DBFC|nr:sensor domain-containing protein [Mycolicibacterium sp. S2-37]MBO0678215.1 sensor domain-containing protein [Mycolicibacterium sp. S2-37]
MPSLRMVSTAVVTCLLLAGCASQVDGRAVDSPAAPHDPAPYVARALDQVLPTTQELSGALGIAPTGFMGQLVQGGADMLLHGVDRAQAFPAECVSATYRLQQMTYAASPVRSVATRSWAGGGVDGPSLTGFFGVVQFASSADAQAFFASAAEKWRQCDGRTMVLQQRGQGAGEQSRITDVVVDPRMVSAVVVHEAGEDGITLQRALGVAADCIVDIEITDVADAKAGGADDAVDIADVMLAKVAQ